MTNMTTNVWVEKYRPTEFDNIVLDPLNKKILKNIIETEYFPNLLFYGPPGTGKTTTIINLINLYQDKMNQRNKELMIHLNASDERGIDVIRNQIYNFVNSKTIFHVGMKFVILDEVDYMTKNAQQALRYLLHNFSTNVRFCLICNYISRIDEGLQNEFLRLKFNQLPEKEITLFLDKISKTEKLNLTSNSLDAIQQLYKTDIRSMINFMQTNQNINCDEISVIDTSVWKCLFNKLTTKVELKLLNKHINEISAKYNIDNKNIIKEFLNYIIRTHKQYNTPVFFNFVENVIHFEDCKPSHYVNYVLIHLLKLLY
jgi:replication factor C subunit 3/5